MSHRTALQRNANRWAAAPEWYTPGWLLERVAAFLGPDWYDPCPASHGKPQTNGLAASWAKQRVYCNPPYGKPIAAWIRKAMTEPVRECILLVPAYTETAWFAPLYDYTLLFFRGRVYFDVAGKEATCAAPHPSVLVYRGRRYRQFADAFADLGPVVRTYRPRRAAQPHLLLPLSEATTQPESEAM